MTGPVHPTKTDGNLGISVEAHELTDVQWADLERLAGVVNDLRAFVIDYYAFEADFGALLATESEIATAASASVNASMLDVPAMGHAAGDRPKGCL